MVVRYRKKDFVGFLYILPWLIGFLIFRLYPFIMSFYYSFSDYTMLKPPRYVGLYNFIYMFTKDELFPKALLNTIKYVIITVPLKISFALFVAIILNMKLKGINLFRTVYYLPSIFGGSVAISILWRFLFMKEGIVNKFLSLFRIEGINWLGDPRIAMFSVSLLAVWQFGSSMVLFLARLKEIPSELYEAALVDGASRLKMFTKITLPMISPIMFFNLVMQTINAFQEFTGPYIITGGGPVNSTYLLSMLIYDNAFKYFRMGYAAALSWVQFVIILIFTAFIFRSSTYWTYYEYDEGRF
ncbi:oligogalacturonide ABC transporter membrane protein [Caldicellulosiruptor bescii]|uniref:Binding-protein-dependent transport systems inner membrane component n=2 Tax=Caldicellulosiruptor bescii TaxID=31899 RepID=B9MNB4_CALBD|nr:sugar ABC transporter permease [Caldicellulosiruptor bescii]ACM61445.1 binding-protein-dependent transport systems inner membrane component [Caldicellulosiruptor bescii DSM 6725]PBC88742.1 oligogalacturonide ABC transporter membrane protein [Caldicellulosiruptor bescii]PBC91777.1 oligogalacturonide ABC transporter membrane protein [Caldicellulosiruptor bescii]PBD02812.1 oligogalacturonide ABC transporter membrane protein [Caldicellulosiruptor bescii]PBD07572.1 oligogalacturonide ABC transpo